METSRISRGMISSRNELSSPPCITANYDGIESSENNIWEIKEGSTNFKQDKEKGRSNCCEANDIAWQRNGSAINISCVSKQVLPAVKTNAVAFHIPAGQAVCKPPPKRFCNQRNKGRENVSLEFLTEKQKLAERRKNQLLEQRLKRIHERQEAARKLAHNVEILLHQRFIAGAGRDLSQQITPQMTSSELLATARHVAKDFSRLKCQMRKDFDFQQETNNNNISQKAPRCSRTHQIKKHSQEEGSSNNNNRSVAFTVSFNDDKQPLPEVPKTLQMLSKTKKSRLTAQDLEEKQRKAEERRNQKRQDKVSRVIANREALLKLASDLNTFMTWNDPEQCSLANGGDDKAPRHQYQAAQLANDIADSFDRLSQRYTKDLKQAEGYSFSW
ncbi:uncharacterized protein [Montipora capricornis]|uniref:uncharacterized protein isoform X1 n=1 Tax=Montipora capricornis TaxID=246305 RepID=UPI0035F18046